MLFVAARKNRLECEHNVCIKLASDGLRETHTCHTARHRVAIRALRRHSVISIRNGQYPRNKWNLVSCNAIWIALAVHAFVMVPDDSCDFGVILNVRENPFTDRRVLFHLPPLRQSQRPRLFKQTGRQAYLPHVVDESAEVSQSLIGFVKPKALGDCFRVICDCS